MNQDQQTEVQSNAPIALAAEINRLASTSPVLKAVCQVFAKRQRARAQITLNHLSRVMSQNGFKYTDNQYADVLRALNKLGIGKLDFDSKGTLQALVGIKYRLQTLGKAAEGDRDLSTFTSRTGQERFSPLADLQNNTRMPNFTTTSKTPPPSQKDSPKTIRAYTMFLTVMINGNPVVFQGPKLDPADFGDFLLNFNALTRKEERGRA